MIWFKIFKEHYSKMFVGDCIEFLGSKDGKSYSYTLSYREIKDRLKQESLEEIYKSTIHLVQTKFKEYFNIEEPKIKLKAHYYEAKYRSLFRNNRITEESSKEDCN